MSDQPTDTSNPAARQPVVEQEPQAGQESNKSMAPGVAAQTGHLLPKIVSFDALARCGDEIWIENEGQIYRLRRTRQGKLILTK
jgi:hemin uptake protein HemP